MNLPPEVLLLDDARKDFNEYAGAAHRSGCHEDVVSLRQDIKFLQQHNQLLQLKVDEQAQKLNRQPQEIVFKVNVAEFLRGGEVNLHSDLKMVGTYTVDMQFDRVYPVGGDSCGVYYLQVTGGGPFPCRVFVNIEVVNWDGKETSNYKIEYAHTYEHATDHSIPQILDLCNLTDTASPYVKDGHVTFIAKFQILPLA